MIEEITGHFQERKVAAEAEVRLIDRQHNQTAARQVLVAGISVGELQRGLARRRCQRHPLGADDSTRRVAVADGEVGWLEIGRAWPLPSNTVTSIDVTSTDDWKVGV